VTFAADPSNAAAAGVDVGIERVDEGHVAAGKFVVTRRLNGDETHQGRHLRLPMGALGVQRVSLYRFK
jgi:hypothetical protein